MTWNLEDQHDHVGLNGPERQAAAASKYEAIKAEAAVEADRSTEAHAARVKAQEGQTGQWYAEGRVPGGRRSGWSTKAEGPFATRAEAVAWGRSRRLGGLKVWEVAR